jgi:hypothetical protein
MPNPDAMELPRATYRSPRCSVEPIEVVVVVDATVVDDPDGASARGDELSLEHPTTARINEPATIVDATRDIAFVTFASSSKECTSEDPHRTRAPH